MEEVLEWFNHHCASAPTSDPKLAARGNQIDLHHCFTCACSLSNKAGPAVEKAVIMQENRWTSSLIAKPLQHLLHAVCKFVLQADFVL